MALQCPCSMLKQFSRDLCCRGSQNPVAGLWGSQLGGNWPPKPTSSYASIDFLMSTGCKSRHSSFLDVSHRNGGVGGLRISGWIGQLSCLTILTATWRLPAWLAIYCTDWHPHWTAVYSDVGVFGSVRAIFIYSVKFIYTDDICIATQGQYFRELECRLSSDMAWMSHFCRQWRIKPGVSKTISSVFHLHYTSTATHELSVYLDGQHLGHECHPTYLGMTLDSTLSYREHFTKTAGKLKNWNNLLMKLGGFSWGANANTLRSSTLVLCYSAVQ